MPRAIRRDPHAGLQGTVRPRSAASWPLPEDPQGAVSFIGLRDIYRPAAVEQLKVWRTDRGRRVQRGREQGCVQIAANAIREAKSKNKNVVIIDTAAAWPSTRHDAGGGGHQKGVSPGRSFRVDSMTGQDAVNTARTLTSGWTFRGWC